MFDETDAIILSILQENARIPNAEIARRVEMAPSAVLERVRKLEERGAIRTYDTILDPKEAGQGLLAFVLVRTKGGCWQAGTAEKLASFASVQEVHHIAGEDCFLVKVRARDTGALGAFLRDQVNGIETVHSTRTTIVLETAKETLRLDLSEIRWKEDRS